jgi:hypothetical protein
MHVARNGSAGGVFRPDNLAKTPKKAKNFFPRFSIRLPKDHIFANFTYTMVTLLVRDFKGQLHWLDGKGRITIDASSSLIEYGSSNPHSSADFELSLSSGHVVACTAYLGVF